MWGRHPRAAIASSRSRAATAPLPRRLPSGSVSRHRRGPPGVRERGQKDEGHERASCAMGSPIAIGYTRPDLGPPRNASDADAGIRRRGNGDHALPLGADADKTTASPAPGCSSIPLRSSGFAPNAGEQGHQVTRAVSAMSPASVGVPPGSQGRALSGPGHVQASSGNGRVGSVAGQDPGRAPAGAGGR